MLSLVKAKDRAGWMCDGFRRRAKGFNVKLSLVIDYRATYVYGIGNG